MFFFSSGENSNNNDNNKKKTFLALSCKHTRFWQDLSVMKWGKHRLVTLPMGSRGEGPTLEIHLVHPTLVTEGANKVPALSSTGFDLICLNPNPFHGRGETFWKDSKMSLIGSILHVIRVHFQKTYLLSSYVWVWEPWDLRHRSVAASANWSLRQKYIAVLFLQGTKAWGRKEAKKKKKTHEESSVFWMKLERTWRNQTCTVCGSDWLWLRVDLTLQLYLCN